MFVYLIICLGYVSYKSLFLFLCAPICSLLQTEDSEIDVDEDDDEDDEDEVSKDLEDDSLEGLVPRGARPHRGCLRPSLREESDNDF